MASTCGFVQTLQRLTLSSCHLVPLPLDAPLARFYV